MPHRIFEGNRPIEHAPARTSSRRATLGKLIALYEHSVFVQGAIWNIDSFDQWGVELGKALATRIAADWRAPQSRLAHDSSTNALIRAIGRSAHDHRA